MLLEKEIRSRRQTDKTKTNREKLDEGERKKAVTIISLVFK